MGVPWSSAGKKFACNVGDLGSSPGLGRSPGEGKGYPLQIPGEFHGLYSPWGCKSPTQLSDFHFHLGVSMHRIMSTANSDNFTSSFLIWAPFISLSSLIVLDRTPKTMLNNIVKSEHSPCFCS